MSRAKRNEERARNDRAIGHYQMWCLSLFFPFLLAFIALAIGLSGQSLVYSLGLAALRSLALYFAEHPLSGNGAASSFLLVSLGFLFALLGVFLALRAAKGKRYPFFVGIALLGADLLLAFLSYLPGYPYPLSVAEIAILSITHLVFLVLLSISLAKYAKLSQILEKEGKR